jgi:hypothetical protein
MNHFWRDKAFVFMNAIMKITILAIMQILLLREAHLLFIFYFNPWVHISPISIPTDALQPLQFLQRRWVPSNQSTSNSNHHNDVSSRKYWPRQFPIKSAYFSFTILTSQQGSQNRQRVK